MAMNPIDRVLGFLGVWGTQIAIVAMFASLACWFLRKAPGNVHASIWTSALLLAWIIPFSPWVLPVSVKLSLGEPIVKQVRIVSPGDMAVPSIPNFVPRSHPSMERRVTPSLLQDEINSPRQEVTVNALVSRPMSVSWMTWGKMALLIGWLGGVLYFILRWFHLRNRLIAILRIAREIEDSHVRDIVERTRQLLFLEGPIRLLTTKAAIAPFVMGLRKPILFLPSSVIETWSQREIQAVAGHELGHLLRYDLLVHIVMQLLRAVFWFWPPVWWMQRELHRSQDAACDECAAVVLGSGLQFGETLTRLAEHCLIQDCAFPALGMVHTRHALIKRLENIMNQKIVKLTRVSLRYKLSLFSISILLFGLGGLFTQAVGSQTLDLKFLANYPDYVVEDTIGSGPFFTVVHRDRGIRYVTFYSFQNGQWIESKRIQQTSPVGNERIAQILSDERYTLIVRNIDSKTYNGWIIDRNQSDKEIQFDFVSRENSVLRQIRLHNGSVYVLVDLLEGDQTPDGANLQFKQSILYQYSFPNNNPEVKTFSLPNDAQASDFVLRDNMVFFNIRTPSEDQNGITVAHLTDRSELVLESERWFYGETSTGSQQPLRLETNGSELYVSVIEQGLQTGESILVVDWNDIHRLKIKQRIPFESTPDSQEMMGTFSVSGDGQWLGARVEKIWLNKPPATPQPDVYLSLYQRIGNEYQFVSTIPYFPYDFSIWDNKAIGLESQKIHVYDLADASHPKELIFPLANSDKIYKTASSHSYVYYVVPEGMDHKFIALDTAVPSDVRVVEERKIALRQPVQIAARDSLLALFSQEQNQFYCFQLDKTGQITSEISSPVFPEDLSVSIITCADWNERLFVFSCLATSKSNPANKDTYILIYDRQPSGFGTLLSTIKLTDVGMRGMNLIGNRLMLTSERCQIADDNQRRVFIYSMTLYSLENRQRPELLVEQDLASSILPLNMNYAVNQEYFVSNFQSMGISDSIAKVFDIRDPHNPKETTVDLPNFTYATWYQGTLVLYGSEELSFYRIDANECFSPIGKIQVGSIARSLSFSDYRMFVPRSSLGLDIYQILQIDSTGVSDWTQF